MRAAILVLLLAGCSSIDTHERVQGWPKMTITEHRVPHAEMHARCSTYAPLSTPLACAEFNLSTRHCDIWLSQDLDLRFIVEHERLHCEGYDHPGSTHMDDFFLAHRGQEVLQGMGIVSAWILEGTK